MNPDETVIWSGKPVKKAFILRGLASIPFGLIFLGFFLFMMWGAASAGGQDFFTLFSLPFVLIGIGLTFGPSILQLMRYNNNVHEYQ